MSWTDYIHAGYSGSISYQIGITLIFLGAAFICGGIFSESSRNDIL